MLPARMNLTLRACGSQSITMPANTTRWFRSQELYLPTSGTYTDDWAGSFWNLMRIYNTCIVRKVTVKATIQALNGDRSSAQLTQVGGEAVACILPRSRYEDYVSAVGYEQLQLLSNAQLKYLGSSEGGHDVVNFSHSIDIEKFAGFPLTSDHAITRENDPSSILAAATIPSNREAANLPLYVIAFKAYGPTSAESFNRQYALHYDTYYDCSFTDIGLQTLDPGIQVGITVNIRQD